MKERYIDLMEKALSAYSDEHINRYFTEVKKNGLTEHGFPRLTADIGILIAHGRRKDLLPVFIEMMEFCCKTIPCVKAANDFSVREIVCCLVEIEQNEVVPKELTKRWRNYFSEINPTTCYNQFATSPDDKVRNWALFTAVSEYFRQSANLCDSSDFIELQILQQLQWFDENGMYKDNKHADIHNPIVYDLVPRGLFSLLLNHGYRGKYYDRVDNILKKAGLLTLKMQSPNGELAFGGRSNQFLHNEPGLCVVYEYEAKRYAGEDNTELSKAFKAAADRALSVTEQWLSEIPIRHIKNRFETETKFGCETYAYFDKYMITVASVLYMAYLICDDSIVYEPEKDDTPCVAVTSEYFHKLFLKSGGYGLEFDLNADTAYDANGLGRIHKAGATSTICLSVPCPKKPSYTIDIDNPIAFSACSAIHTEKGWIFGADENTKYEIAETEAELNSARATLFCHFENGKSIKEQYTVNDSGVSITTEGEGEIAFLLPAFEFDGETKPVIEVEKQTLSVSYKGWICRYTTNGTIGDLNKVAANRNGHYHIFYVAAREVLKVKIEIFKNK